MDKRIPRLKQALSLLDLALQYGDPGDTGRRQELNLKRDTVSKRLVALQQEEIFTSSLQEMQDALEKKAWSSLRSQVFRSPPELHALPAARKLCKSISQAYEECLREDDIQAAFHLLESYQGLSGGKNIPSASLSPEQRLLELIRRAIDEKQWAHLAGLVFLHGRRLRTDDTVRDQIQKAFSQQMKGRAALPAYYLNQALNTLEEKISEERQNLVNDRIRQRRKEIEDLDRQAETQQNDIQGELNTIKQQNENLQQDLRSLKERSSRVLEAKQHELDAARDELNTTKQQNNELTLELRNLEERSSRDLEAKQHELDAARDELNTTKQQNNELTLELRNLEETASNDVCVRIGRLESDLYIERERVQEQTKDLETAHKLTKSLQEENEKLNGKKSHFQTELNHPIKEDSISPSEPEDTLPSNPTSVPPLPQRRPAETAKPSLIGWDAAAILREIDVVYKPELLDYAKLPDGQYFDFPPMELTIKESEQTKNWRFIINNRLVIETPHGEWEILISGKIDNVDFDIEGKYERETDKPSVRLYPVLTKTHHFEMAKKKGICFIVALRDISTRKIINRLPVKDSIQIVAQPMLTVKFHCLDKKMSYIGQRNGYVSEGKEVDGVRFFDGNLLEVVGWTTAINQKLYVRVRHQSERFLYWVQQEWITLDGKKSVSSASFPLVLGIKDPVIRPSSVTKSKK